MVGITTEDWVAVSDHMGRYCWLVDGGLSDEWVTLWTADGVFTGLGPEPVVGTEQLKAIPRDAFAGYDGQMRHQIGNLHCSYGDNRDTVIARFYNHVTVWGGKPGAGNFVMALCEATLVRSGDGWLIKRNDSRLLTP